MLVSTDRQDVETALLRTAKVYKRMLKLGLVAVIAAFFILVGLSYLMPPYLPNFSIGFVVCMYFIVGLLMGMSWVSSLVYGKDWLKLARILEKSYHV